MTPREGIRVRIAVAVDAGAGGAATTGGQMSTDAKPCSTGASSSEEYRDLRDGQIIIETDEFWDDDYREFVPLHKCASVSARWMIGSPYSSNFFVRARRPMTPPPNSAPSSTEASRE